MEAVSIKAVKGRDGSVMAWTPSGESVYWSAEYSNRPDYRFRYATVNCMRYRLEWVR